MEVEVRDLIETISSMIQSRGSMVDDAKARNAVICRGSSTGKENWRHGGDGKERKKIERWKYAECL